MDIAYEEEHHLMEVIMMVEFFIWLWLLLFWIINGISTHDAQPTMCNHIGGVIVAGAATAAMLVVSSSRKIVIIFAQTEAKTASQNCGCVFFLLLLLHSPFKRTNNFCAQSEKDRRCVYLFVGSLHGRNEIKKLNELFGEWRLFD